MSDHATVPAGPIAAGDLVNRIARVPSTDTAHHLHVWDGGELVSITLAEVSRRAARVARHLRSLGVQPRDRVGVIAANRLEWVLLDLATLHLGGVVAGIEPGRHDAVGMVREFGLKLVFTDTATAAEGPVHDIAEVGGWSLDADADQDDDRPDWAGYDPADIFAIKQTSGSTGPPKGIETTVASVNASLVAVQQMFDHTHGDNLLVFLPVRYLQQRYWIYSALVHGHDVTLADRATALDVAQAAHPTVVMGVPGFYDRLRARVESTGAEAAGPDLAARRAAIQAELGGRVRYLWTGSAPAGLAVLHYFNDAGVPLYEGYGLNETCIVAKNHPGAFRLGSVGKPLPHKRVRFDRDGVLVVGTDHPVNTRYTWSAPGASEKVYLPTGEVRTYDVGHLDEDGFLYIDGRVDDIVTLSAALNILVPAVEERVRELPQVRDCAVVGDGRPYLVAVVSAAAPALDAQALAADVVRLNQDLRYEQRLVAVLLAPEPFSQENGLLGGQDKLARARILERFAADLERVYREHDVYNDGTATQLPVRVFVAGDPAGPPDPRESGHRTAERIDR
jgi:long-subunit acyl-CoA synthetase (AMP-forming)